MLLAADRTPEPLPADRAAKAMVLPEGFHGTVFAAEPDVVQPISFCIDARGRLFVAEALNYGAWQPTGKDRIVILEDKDGDGRADHAQGLLRGIQLHHRHRGRLRRRVGDVAAQALLHPLPGGRRQAERRAAKWSSTASATRKAGTTSPTASPGGRTAGSTPAMAAPAPPTSARPGTPADQRIHCDGGVYRIHPTRRVFENFADGTTNPWGVDFDDYGQCFVSNCVNPHLFHMIQGGHYEPWRNRPSSLYAYERLPTCADHLHYPSGKPKEMRGETSETLAMGGGHAHCGTLVYLGDRFPAQYPQHRLHVQHPRPAHQQRPAAPQGFRLHRQPRQGLHDCRRSLVHGRDAADRARTAASSSPTGPTPANATPIKPQHHDRPDLQDRLWRAGEDAGVI